MRRWGLTHPGVSAGPKSPADVEQIRTQERYGKHAIRILHSLYSFNLAPLPFNEQQLSPSPDTGVLTEACIYSQVGFSVNKVAHCSGWSISSFSPPLANRWSVGGTKKHLCHFLIFQRFQCFYIDTKEMFIAYARVFMFLISWGQHISAMMSSFFLFFIRPFISWLVGLTPHLCLPLWEW